MTSTTHTKATCCPAFNPMNANVPREVYLFLLGSETLIAVTQAIHFSL
jgi:hypothetical protein